MRRLVPYPVLSAALALSWVGLTALSPGHVATAARLGLVIPLVMAPFLQGLPSARRPLRALHLLLQLIWDILIANVVVAALVLGPGARLRPVFFEVPLTLSDPLAISLLASMVTITPGTVSVALTPDARLLHVHALSAEDTEELLARIKARYERPLLEIFPC